MNKDDIITLAVDCTGSIMSTEEVKNEYTSLTLPKRGYLYREARQYIKNIDRLRKNYPADHILNTNFNAVLGIMAVNLNVIAACSNVDPAIVFLSAIDKLNKKY